MRRFGDPARPGRAYTTRPGAYGVVREGRDVLLTEQSAPERELQLPGGGVDRGESAVRALHRECLEETGWRIRVLRRLGAFQRFTYMPDYDLWARKVCHIYLCRPVIRLGAPAEPAHRALWMPIALAAQLVDGAGDRAFLAALIRRGTARAGPPLP